MRRCNRDHIVRCAPPDNNDWLQTENRELRRRLRLANEEIARLNEQPAAKVVIGVPYCPALAEKTRRQRASDDARKN
jgi:hypothetical protein